MLENPKFIVVEDTGQKEGEHLIKHAWWSNHQIAYRRFPLPVGDYVLANHKIADVVNRKIARGISIKKMDFLGTYNICVDTKKDIQEIIGNICGKSHGRFRDECILAQNNNIKLIILVENRDNVYNFDDLIEWDNPRRAKYDKIKQLKERGKAKNVKLAKLPPTSGRTLARAMQTMEAKYGVKFLFCSPEESGETIMRILLNPTRR